MEKLIYGSAYYDEYMPVDRIDKDVAMMTAAGHTTVRIAESTWSTLEPQPGVFDFTHVDRAVDAMEAVGIDVIVGTPTYAVPSWLVQSHPDVLALTRAGAPRYGARQIMDITNPAYRFYAERVIRRLMEHTADRRAVIGFQLDNETKYYNTVSPYVQRAFVKHLRERFDGDLAALNRAFGLDYWSNRIDAWEDFPDVQGTINGSLGSAFDRFRRGLVEEFLAWQASIVREYARDDQFLTQNFDFDWKPGWSYGMQPSVDHFAAARTVDVAGVDIYHPTQSHLTGIEIAFGGDVMRSVKGGANYLVLETQAQGQMGWLPYPGQLRLQAYSHLASGADGVMYWHWHSIHHSFETYWKGLLSHDLAPNPTYEESAVVGREWAEHAASLLHLRKNNRVAIMVSNEALTALQWFTLETGFIDGAYRPSIGYNDVLRWMYDALFALNVEVDFIHAESEDLDRYALILTPALYSAPQQTVDRLRAYVAGGGHLFSTFRTVVADENVEVWHDAAPHGLTDVFGATYNQFSTPDGARVAFADEAIPTADAEAVLELLRPTGAEVLASYAHPAWGEYAALTRNGFGEGEATYLATKVAPDALGQLLADAVRRAGLWDWPQDLAGSITVRRGTNGRGRAVTYFLNYSGGPVTVEVPTPGDVVVGDPVSEGRLTVAPWSLAVVEEAGE
ncbi:MAG: beta-galactosidase [Tessaracoccus sp.]|uniref:beta-galactosidase n=1 Tax=Tessaracoccus sp. TaxID=1971211 RepID=UPI001EC379E4|nr:beta-galactosidase [Tessaracoccus sp.]MBK7820583.1 beta-galactosidase [Tessaracoccus sp.]